MWMTSWESEWERAEAREGVRDCGRIGISRPWDPTYLAWVGPWSRPFDSGRGVVAGLFATLGLFAKARARGEKSVNAGTRLLPAAARTSSEMKSVGFVNEWLRAVEFSGS